MNAVLLGLQHQVAEQGKYALPDQCHATAWKVVSIGPACGLLDAALFYRYGTILRSDEFQWPDVALGCNPSATCLSPDL